MVSFAMQKFVSLVRSHLFPFAFISIALGDRPKKTLVQFMSENVLPVFSSRNFMVSCLIFNSLTHIEFMFVYGVRVCSKILCLYSSFSLVPYNRGGQIFFIKHKIIISGFVGHVVATIQLSHYSQKQPYLIGI